jgi:hypothetical protein
MNVRIIVAALVLFSAAALLFGRPSDPSDSQLPFDSEVWKHQAEDDGRPKSIPDLWKHREADNVRLRMVSDVKPKLMGISKAEVEKLLGTPMKDVGSLGDPGDYFYSLAVYERFMDTDGVLLHIKFKNDRVTSVDAEG